MARKYEQLFEGKANQGLRKRIRAIADAFDTPLKRANAIRMLRHSVALSHSGECTLEAVATDYEILGGK